MTFRKNKYGYVKDDTDSMWFNSAPSFMEDGTFINDLTQVVANRGLPVGWICHKEAVNNKWLLQDSSDMSIWWVTLTPAEHETKRYWLGDLIFKDQVIQKEPYNGEHLT